MEKLNLKYVLYGVAALFTILIFYELTKSKDLDYKPVDTSVVQTSEPEKKPEKKKAELFKVKPAKNDISGPLNGFFEVVERSYKIVERKVNVEMRRLKEGFPEPWKQGMELGYADGRFEPGFYIEVLDSDGDIVGKDETSITYDRTALEILSDLNIGETASLEFDVRADNPVSFRVGSSFTAHEIQQKAEEPMEESNDNGKTPATQSGITYRQPSNSVVSDNIGDQDVYDDGELAADDFSTDDLADDESSRGNRSTWQKVKDKSKKIYRKSKEYTKNTYRKAKQKVMEWLDD